MKYAFLSLALLTGLVSTPAMARDNSAYLEIGGGVTSANDSDYDSTIDPDIEGTIEWGTGFDLAGAAGYDFGAFRAEAEVSFKKHGFDRVISGGTTLEDSDDVDLDFTTWSVMANALVDIGPDDGIQGYVGGGLGFASTELDLRDDRDADLASDQDSDSGFAWQLLAGVRMPISEKVSAGLRYRYFNQSDLSFKVSDDDDLNTDFSTHSLLLTFAFDL